MTNGSRGLLLHSDFVIPSSFVIRTISILQSGLNPELVFNPKLDTVLLAHAHLIRHSTQWHAALFVIPSGVEESHALSIAL